MDHERTSAPHNSPPPIQPTPIDWLLRLRMRAGGAIWPSVLVGAGIAALIQAGVLILLNATELGTGNVSGLAGFPRLADVISVFVGDAAGGLAVGVMARRFALPTAGLTGFILRLPRFFAMLHGAAPVFVIGGVRINGVGSLLLVAGGMIVVSTGIWVLTAWLGHALATRRLNGLGLL